VLNRPNIQSSLMLMNSCASKMAYFIAYHGSLRWAFADGFTLRSHIWISVADVLRNRLCLMDPTRETHRFLSSVHATDWNPGKHSRCVPQAHQTIEYDIPTRHAPRVLLKPTGYARLLRRFGGGPNAASFHVSMFGAEWLHWDPAVTASFAKNRPFILCDNAGVASSSCETTGYDRCDGRARPRFCRGARTFPDRSAGLLDR